MSNIPSSQVSTDSSTKVKKYFNDYFNKNISYSSNQVDAVIAFFVKRGFGEDSSISVASVLLKQAKIDNVKVFALLDTLKGLTEVQLSTVVTQILNASRARTSELGYKISEPAETSEQRNIIV